MGTPVRAAPDPADPRTERIAGSHLERVTYAQLGSAGVAERIGITARHAESLRRHPYASPDDVAFLLLISESGQRVARFGLIPGLLTLASVDRRVQWGSEYESSGEARHAAAVGLLLLRAMAVAGSLCGCGPSARSRPLLEAARSGFIPLERRATLIRSATFLRRRAPDIAVRTAAPLVDALLAARSMWRSRGRGDHQLVAVDRFDARVDEIERSVRGPAWFPRWHAELNWALEHPWSGAAEGYRHRAFYLDGRSGETIGYAIARVRSIPGATVLGSIMRASVRPIGRAPEELMVGVISALADDGAHVVDLHSNRAAMLGPAVKLGMLRRMGTSIACRFDPSTDDLVARSGGLERIEADMSEGDGIFL